MSASSATVDEDRRCRIGITEQELLCKNQCGFYGTSQCNGLCSQCWRNHQQEQKRVQDFNKNRSLLTKEERRLAVDPKSVVRSVIKKSPSVFSSPLSTSSSSVLSQGNESPVEFHFTRSSSPDSLEADSQLHKYIKKNFSPSHAKDLERSCNLLIEKLYKDKQTPMEDLEMIVQHFYTEISDRALKFGPIGSDFVLNELLEHIEDFICVRAHGILFCTRSDEEILDISLQDRIRTLHWITQGFLETVLDFDSGTVDDLLNDAMAEISEMNSHKKIREKFDCLMKCSTKIFDALRESTNAPASADEFLPALIYIILKSNPTLMQSNMSFILRFSLPSRTSRGETGEQLIVEVITFPLCVRLLATFKIFNAEKIGIPKDDFEAYTSNMKTPPKRPRSHISATKSLELSLKQMEQLNKTQETLKARADQLSESIERRFAELHTQLDKLQNAPTLEMPPELDTKKLARETLAGTDPQEPTSTTANNVTAEEPKVEEVPNKVEESEGVFEIKRINFYQEALCDS
ncbi:hypothetical protein M3Y97_00932100 [Aphelenchoides bicaudatus]|nr:hypothetical protein M3Y97_00932100 [Aphelenchoides bicaudatus]